MYGQVVRRARLERGLTQADLAAISGIDQPNISAIENGRRHPSAETFHRLLMACGYELLAAAGERIVSVPSPEDALDESPLTALDPVGDLSMDDRVRMLTAALDAAEAILRHR